MNDLNLNNAAKRSTYVGTLFEKGTEKEKNEIIQSINKNYSKLHKEGYIHIHDLEAYGKTYNCLTPDVLKNFPLKEFEGYSDHQKIMEIFEHYKYIISNLANEQTGGIAFGNFDSEIDTLLNNLNVSPDNQNLRFLKECINSFIKWINVSRIRYGQECYYVSINIGLCIGKFGRFVTESLIDSFMASSNEYIRPNIVFKVKQGINMQINDPNYKLFCLAVKCTSKKMIPTYLLCDSEPNRNFDPDKIAIMGCRTRVMQNINGEETSIGRGNIDYITINLPRIAFEVNEDPIKKDLDEKLHCFKAKWLQIAEVTKEILLDRYYKLLNCGLDSFPFNIKSGLWITDFEEVQNLEEVFKNGTLSLGFIGLSEAVEVLIGEKYFSSSRNHELAINIISFMRQEVDRFREEEGLNFTLLATSGEFISGRFPDIDSKYYKNSVIKKGYYTNSFHVDVNGGMNPFEKLKYEGPFHQLCNGGSISYIEFIEAPLSNTEAIIEIIESGIKFGISYLGINYPLDICKTCDSVGTFDYCSVCGSTDVKRIRRVSGYLEELDYFTNGKKQEIKYRTANVLED